MLMLNHLKSAHGVGENKGKQFMLVKINSVPSNLEELQHFASFPNIVYIFTLKKLLQFRFMKYLLLKLKSRVKSVSRMTEINRAMVMLVLRKIMFPYSTEEIFIKIHLAESSLITAGIIYRHQSQPISFKKDF